MFLLIRYVSDSLLMILRLKEFTYYNIKNFMDSPRLMTGDGCESNVAKP